MNQVKSQNVSGACAVLIDQTECCLSPEQWQAFCERLEEPAEVIPALQQIFSEAKQAENL